MPIYPQSIIFSGNISAFHAEFGNLVILFHGFVIALLEIRYSRAGIDFSVLNLLPLGIKIMLVRKNSITILLDFNTGLLLHG